jgi:hypothetical protein
MPDEFTIELDSWDAMEGELLAAQRGASQLPKLDRSCVVDNLPAHSSRTVVLELRLMTTIPFNDAAAAILARVESRLRRSVILKP